MKTIQEVSKDTLKIEAFIKSHSPGDFISYDDIEKDAKVEMNIAGKGYMRTALKRLKFEYLVKRGKGIEIASVNTAMTIMSHRLIKIDNSVKRGEKSYNNMIPFYSELDDDDQKRITFLGAAFGAIRLAAQNGKKYLSQKKEFTPSSKEFVRI